MDAIQIGPKNHIRTKQKTKTKTRSKEVGGQNTQLWHLYFVQTIFIFAAAILRSTNAKAKREMILLV
jgi:hypothetical protein